MDQTSTTAYASETLAGMAAKATPSVSVSVAHVMGVPLADLVLWATLFYTALMAAHKAWQFYVDVAERRRAKPRRK